MSPPRHLIVVVASVSLSAGYCLPSSSSSSSADCHLRCSESPSSLVVAFVTGVCPLLRRRLCLWLLIKPDLLESSPLFRRLPRWLIVVSGVRARRLPLSLSSSPAFAPSCLRSFSANCFDIASFSAEQRRRFKVSPGVFLKATCFAVTSVKIRLSSLSGRGGEV